MQLISDTPRTQVRSPAAHDMDHTNKITVAAILLVFLQTAKSGGSSNKVQIHVPHNIQHHHHTHTKYHFITLPLVKPPNRTDAISTPSPPIIMPVVPLLPGMVAFANTTPAPAPPLTPAPAPPATPPPVPQQPAFQPIPNFFPVNPNAMYMHDYDYVDTPNRRSREKVIRIEQPAPQMKFKTIINVQETKKIPLSEIFNLNHLIPKDPPRRIKVDVYPEKTSHVKQTQKIMAEWHALQEALKANPYPGMNLETLEWDTNAYQSMPEIVTERPELETLKKLLEKHINEDFPGLMVKANIQQVDEPMPIKENPADERSGKSGLEDSTESSLEYKHIGYIVVDDKNKQHFIGVNDPNVT